MASYFQAYFQSSSMPKRLLQYALFRLDIFDTDTLDLDSLDIAWGKKCVFEFKNVGLRLKKIESLLRLPPSFETVKARVLLLRLTIPVDIYSSPIVVEVDGVECLLRFRESPAQQRSRGGRQDQSHPNASKPAKPRRGSHNLAGEENDTGGEADSTLPSAVDLAESFLQTEPEEDKVGLEAAILTESPEIGSSFSSIESGDNDTTLGTGTALSLPTFMARFLTGIMDRLQIRIRCVTLGLDVEIPSETPSSASAESVTVQLRVDDIDIEGVTHELERTPPPGDTASRFPLKKGKRLVCLSKIRGELISEADTFTARARTSSTSSPSTTHSDFSDAKTASPKMVSSRQKTASKTYDAASSTGGLSHPSSSHIRSMHHDTDLPASLQGSAIASDFGRFDDASEDEYGTRSENLDSMEQSVATDGLLQSGYLDQLTSRQDSQLIEQAGDGSIHSALAEDYGSNLASRSYSSNLATSDRELSPELSRSGRDLRDSHFESDRGTDSALQSSILPTRQHSRFSRGRVSQSQSSLPDRAGSPPTNIAHPLPSTLSQTESIDRAQDEHDSATVDADDLAESQMFSHEDAESMYMSAASYSPLSDDNSGGWTRSNVESGSRMPTIDAVSNDPHPDSSKDRSPATPIQAPSNLHSDDPALLSTLLARDKSELGFSHEEIAPRQREPLASQTPKNAPERSISVSDGYGKVAKHILNIDNVAIYLPGAASESLPPPALGDTTIDSSIYTPSDGSRSTLMNIPGAFSTHLPAQQKPMAPKPPVEEPELKAPETVDTAVEVQIGQATAQVDMSVGMLIWTLFSRLKAALTPESPTPDPAKPKSAPGDARLKLEADNISVQFLERLEGIVPASSSVSDSLPKSYPASTDVLLQGSIRSLYLDSFSSNGKSQTAMTIRKFTFGYAKDNIISCDAGLQMRASVRDLKASAGIDISLDIHKTAESTRFDIKTLPLLVSIDLQRLDETFSWFGGLSSVLNLGSSIASNTTVTATSPSKKKGHGVHFEVPISPDDKSLSSQSKADIRIGGFILNLIGTECSILAETSAVKMVSRDEGIGVGIQKIKLSGPHLKDTTEDSAVEVEITTTRLEYLPAPKDVDLDALLSLITPSKAKYDQDDDILLDTLLRQRKQGGVLRLSVDNLRSRVGQPEKLSSLPGLLEEISKLSTVAKYLPDDDRPGLLSLVKLSKVDAEFDAGHGFGNLKLAADSVEIAHVTLPALAAFSVNSISIYRNGTEELLGQATSPELREPRSRAPAIMARMIGDEMEPVVKIKLWNLQFEYRVPTLIAALDLAESMSLKNDPNDLAASVATLTDLARSTVLSLALDERRRGKRPTPSSKPVTIDVVLRDCICGLNPLGSTSKVLVVLTETHLSATLPKDNEFNATADMNKASLLVIDDISNIKTGNRPARPRRQSFDGGSSQVADLCETGFVPVSYISSAKATVLMAPDEDGDQSINVELRDDLFVLETCADSTQTLITVLNALTPPSPPSQDIKYRTKVIPVEDLLASLSGDAFGTAEGDYNFDDDFDVPEELGGEELGDFDIDSRYYQPAADQYETLFNDEASSSASTHVTTRDTRDGVLLDSIVESAGAADDEDDLEFDENHFGASSIIDGTAHRWNSTKNTYDRSNTNKVKKSPLKICVRQVHIIWNLFDGYDWQHTRDTISRAVLDVESKAIEKRSRHDRRPAFEQDIDDTETVIGDFLFNSIYIGIPANRDPRELTAAINQELNDNATETESVATTSLSASPNRQGPSRTSSKHLRLKRSKHHKITFELKGVCADFVAFPAGSGETQSSIDVRVLDFEIFDHVPTSTWRKFATYMQDAGERETGTSMIHLEILNVKPVPDLAASEMVVKATVLPLRLHVDQDALDFITRFFEFKDDTPSAHSTPREDPFFQRVEVNSVQVKLDFKPKRVDYAGLRSGHTTEFMNFLILDEADMVLRHTIIYGVSGAEKLGKTLNDIWMPDIKRNQLPGILAGLAPVRSIVNVGGGLRHLVLVPMREYQKDGRIVRSLSKGAAAFAKTTGTELVKLGAKVAIGVQTVLQGAEGLLNPPVEGSRGSAEDDGEDEETKQISLYANQPVGVLQGLRGGYDGLQRDLLLARDAIIAVPGEVMDGGNAAGVLRAVRKHAPTVILRPAIGVAKAGGQVLMGATNALDPENIRRAEAKYKRH